MKRTLIAAAALPLFLLAGPALAQQTTGQTGADAEATTDQTTTGDQGVTGGATTGAAVSAGRLVDVEDEAKVVEVFDRRVDEVEDMDIYSATGDEVGEVEDLLMDDQGRIVALTADVGGFLGVGEREVVLQLDQVTLADDRLVVQMTEEELEQLPEWQD